VETANQKLSEAEQKLTAINNNKDLFFSIVAHDLKNPFQGFLGLTDILANEIEELSKEEIVEMAVSINKSAGNLNQLLENLLTWAKLQQDKIIINPVEFNLHKTVEEVFAIFLQSASFRKLNFKNSVPKDTYIIADKNVVFMALRNFISNSVKYAHESGLIEVICPESAKLVRIIVEDEGPGIAETEIEKIMNYDIFNYSDTTGKKHGSGLGLSITRQLATKCGGEIRIERKNNIGCRVELLLPK
jgi:signal transduction histidine kinase